jgi:hypothetical protein
MLNETENIDDRYCNGTSSVPMKKLKKGYFEEQCIKSLPDWSKPEAIKDNVAKKTGQRKVLGTRPKLDSNTRN